MSVEVELMGAEHIRALDLAGLLIHTRYRGIRGLTAVDHETIFRSSLASAHGAGGICFGAFLGGRLQAVGAITPLAWDSQHFGLPMANLLVAARPGGADTGLPVLIGKALTAAHEILGIRHVSAEIDIDDHDCLDVAQAHGFQQMDIKRAYRWYDMAAVPVPKFRSRVREYRPEDRERVLKLVESSNFGSRFSRDHVLAGSRVAAMYQSWLEQLLDKVGRDVIALVFERVGQVEACGVIGTLDLSPAGVPLRFMDKGLYVSGAQGVGGYFPVLYELAARSLQDHVLAQTSVSLGNHAAVRVLDKMQAGSESVRCALRLYRH